jgi:hypothetical protein
MLLWYRPEESSTVRDGYALGLETGASDLGGSVAAALAASSVVFQSLNDTAYARSLLDKSLEVRGCKALGCLWSMCVLWGMPGFWGDTQYLLVALAALIAQWGCTAPAAAPPASTHPHRPIGTAPHCPPAVAAAFIAAFAVRPVPAGVRLCSRQVWAVSGWRPQLLPALQFLHVLRRPCMGSR